MSDRLAHQSSLSESGSAVSVLLTLLVVVSVFVILVFYVFGQIVKPNEIGLRQNFFGAPGLLQKGFQDEGLFPGLHWKIPFVSTVHSLPRDFQFIHLNETPLFGELNLRQLEVPTTDGSKVMTDITLVVRILEEPGEGSTESPAIEDIQSDEKTGVRLVPVAKSMLGKHGGPAALVSRFGITPARQLELFVRQAEDYLRNTLSTLSTSDYYDPIRREQASLRAKLKINETANPLGIELWGSLIRRYTYSEKKIDDQIFAKNLQEQTERLNAARRKLEEARALTKDKLAEWDAKVHDVQVTSEQNKQVTYSEADRYELEQRSRGDLMVQEAVAKVDKAKNEVLASTPGASIYVAREMAPLLSTLQGGVVTDIDPYDVDAWVRKLVQELR